MSPESRKINCGFIQFAVVPGDIEANLSSFVRGLDSLVVSSPGLLVLPEMWSCGFDYSRMDAHGGRTPEIIAILTKTARLLGVFLAGSLPEVDGARIYNTMFLVGPDGIMGRHRKSRLFAPMGEDRFFAPGPLPGRWKTPVAGIAPLVCFELRFPELARGAVASGAEIIVVSAQWPGARIGQWRLLLKARALENQAFVVAANACGRISDEPGGYSGVIAPDGTVLSEAGAGEEAAMVTVDMGLTDTVRQRFSTVASPAPADRAATKVVSREEISEHLAPYRKNGQKVVFTNGCFDILHPGHVIYLEEARRLGDCLVLGLNSDASVRRLKGEERPVNNESGRARVIAALACVDFVVIFGEDTPIELIRMVRPDILVKGGDWPVEKIVGGPGVEAYGGRVLSIPLVAGHSTTGIIDGIKISAP